MAAAPGDAIKQTLPHEEVELTSAQFGMLVYKMFLGDKAVAALIRDSPVLHDRFVSGLATKGSSVAKAYDAWSARMASDLSQIKRDLAVARAKTKLERELYTPVEAKTRLAQDVAALTDAKTDLEKRVESASASTTASASATSAASAPAAEEPVFAPPPPPPPPSFSQMPSLSFDTSAAWPRMNFSDAPSLLFDTSAAWPHLNFSAT